MPSRLALLLLALALTPRPASAQPSEIDEAAAREVALVEFFSADTLPPAEQAELAAAVARAFATDPASARAAATESVKMLALVQRQSGAQQAAARALGRRAIAAEGMQALGSGAEGAAAARLVERHDPTLATDPARHLVVTRQTILALVEGNRAGAALFGVPEPGPDAATALGARLQVQWPTVDAGLRLALADAPRVLPYAAPYLAARSGPDRARFVAQWRQKILAAPDPAGVQFNIAEVMAFIGEAGFKSGAGGGGAMAGIAGIRGRQAAIDTAGRAVSGLCSAPAGATLSPERMSFCHPRPFP